MVVTRREIAEHLEGAFGSGPLKRGQVISAAESQGARSDVLSVLGRLPDGFYPHLRSLWDHLPEVPRDAQPHVRRDS
ncbi:hypothetical protein HDA32_002226 [Spinactinospora alkalitolerans]|uniref:DUF2795 domain-containing protein n=1 Tax=Spinactinospora alkalitolerans TaxID=687207 RepID=A0A852TRT4_9ACTN|nr:DUF2795 domain-containing protein [Spinactinospora alkalitolerans]NYE47106.1 hypothetical protein [Spinactinospora alkalitolerans]